MPEWEQLVRHDADPNIPAPSLDQLFHRTRASERVASTWKGVAIGSIVLALVVIGSLVYSTTLYSRLEHQNSQRAAVRACKDRAFAVVADDAFGSGHYIKGKLLRLYEECDRDPDTQP